MCVARFRPRLLDAAPVPAQGPVDQEGTGVGGGPDRDPRHTADGWLARPSQTHVPSFCALVRRRATRAL
jgi:hypothetical protein